MFPTRISVFIEDRLLFEALVDVLRSQRSLTVVPGDIAGAGGIDVAVVDARSGDSLAQRLKGPMVIFVGAADDDDEWAVEALRQGARGILTRSASRDELLKAVAIVRSGGIWARRRWLNAFVRKDSVRILEESSIGRIPPQSRLSPREQEVFRHAASGAANKDLAQRLAISQATVKVHLTRIFHKLGVSGRAELAAVYYGLRAAPPASTADTRLQAS
jgi:DNA-binding NarL/FixJ family response regulator